MHNPFSGKWRAFRMADTAHVEVVGGPMVVRHVEPSNDVETALKYARCMAASRELYEACNEFIMYCDNPNHDESDWYLMESLMRNAVAQANGEKNSQ
jgi:hypothetical protein